MVTQKIQKENSEREAYEKKAREMLFYQDIDMDNPPISNFFEVTSKQMSHRIKRT